MTIYYAICYYKIANFQSLKQVFKNLRHKEECQLDDMLVAQMPYVISTGCGENLNTTSRKCTPCLSKPLVNLQLQSDCGENPFEIPYEAQERKGFNIARKLNKRGESIYKIELTSLTQGYFYYNTPFQSGFHYLMPEPLQFFLTHVRFSSRMSLNSLKMAVTSSFLSTPLYITFLEKNFQKFQHQSPQSDHQSNLVTDYLSPSYQALPTTLYLPGVLNTSHKNTPMNFSPSTLTVLPQPTLSYPAHCYGLTLFRAQAKFNFSCEPAPSSPPVSDSAPFLR